MSLKNLFFLALRFTFGIFGRQRLKWSITIISLGISVSLLTAVEIVNKTVIGELERASNVFNGFADLNIEGKEDYFDEDIFNKLVKNKIELGIESLSPVFIARKIDLGFEKTIQVLAIDIFRAPKTTPFLFKDLQPFFDENERVSGSLSLTSLLSKDSVFISHDLFEIKKGKDFSIKTKDGEQKLETQGVFKDRSIQRLLLMDIGNAQSIFEMEGRLSRIDLRLNEGADLNVLKKKLNIFFIENGLENSIRLRDDVSRKSEIDELSSAYRENLFVLGMTSLFVTFFLLYAIIELSFVQQRRDFKLLERLGLKKTQFFFLMSVQTSVFTSIGSFLGIFLGLGFAIFLGQMAIGNLSSGLIFSGFGELKFPFQNLIIYWGFGVSAGLIASALIFFQQENYRKGNHLKNLFLKSKLAFFFFLLVSLGILYFLLNIGPVKNTAFGAYLAIFFLILFFIALVPALVPVLAKKTIPFFSNTFTKSGWLTLAGYRLTSENNFIDKNVIRAIITSFSLTIAMVIMISSFRDSLVNWLDSVLEADLYLVKKSNIQDQSNIHTTTTLKKISLVDTVQEVRISYVDVLSESIKVPVISKKFEHKRNKEVLPIIGQAFMPKDFGEEIHKNRVFVYASEGFLNRYKLKVRNIFALNLSGKAYEAVILGKYRDYGRQYGSLTIPSSELTGSSIQSRLSHYAVNLKDKSSIKEFFKEFKKTTLSDQFSVTNVNQIKQKSLQVFDKTFTISYFLVFTSLFVSIFVVICSSVSQVEIRSSEFKLMRFLGQSRTFLIKQVISEQIMLSLVSVIFGLFLGFMISVILIEVVNPQTFFWTIDMRIPFKHIIFMSSITVLSILISVIICFSFLEKKSSY